MFRCVFSVSFWSLWFWTLWLASPTLRGKAAGEESCCLPLEDGGGGEERRAKPGSAARSGQVGQAAPRGAHCPARWARRREPGRPDERAPSCRWLCERRWSWLPWRLSDCGGPVLVLDKVGRLFLIDLSNHNLAEPECGFNIFSLLLKSRVQGWGPGFSG